MPYNDNTDMVPDFSIAVSGNTEACLSSLAEAWQNCRLPLGFSLL